VEEIFDKVKNILGVIKYTPQEWFRLNLSIPESELLEKIEARTNAKKEKNFELADGIRNELKEIGIELLDTVEGTIYRATKIRSID
jgi:cysteinyl-tRNA synthetase